MVLEAHLGHRNCFQRCRWRQSHIRRWRVRLVDVDISVGSTLTIKQRPAPPSSIKRSVARLIGPDQGRATAEVTTQAARAAQLLT